MNKFISCNLFVWKFLKKILRKKFAYFWQDVYNNIVFCRGETGIWEKFMQKLRRKFLRKKL